MAKKAEIALHKLHNARVDYEFGYMSPIFRGQIKDGSTFVDSLDRKEVPEVLLEALGNLHDSLKRKLYKMKIQEHSHIWILEFGKGNFKGEFMIRKCRKHLRVYDCSDTVPNKMPTLAQVAEWHDISSRAMNRKAADEKWSDNRLNRIESMNDEAMALARSEAVSDFLKSSQDKLSTLQKMKSQYDAKLNLGKAVVTSRDLISAMGLAHRIQKDLTTLGKESNAAEDFLKLLIDTGLGKQEPQKVVDVEPSAVEVVDAEVLEVDENVDLSSSHHPPSK